VNEVFRRPLSVGVEVDYVYGPTVEVLARATFTTARSEGPLQFTEYIDTRFPTFQSMSFARVSDYRAWTFEGGHRWRMGNGKRVSPFFGWLAGVAVIEPISISPDDPGAQPTAFYRRTTTPTAAASVGVMFRASRSAAIGIESGPRYQLNSGIGDRQSGSAIRRMASSGQRLSVPVTGVLRFAF
jgi:hypothetical protein